MPRATDGAQRPEVAVLLYPGCIFFEVALAVDTLAPHADVRCWSPDGLAVRSGGVTLQVEGDLAGLAGRPPAALLIPGG